MKSNHVLISVKCDSELCDPPSLDHRYLIFDPLPIWPTSAARLLVFHFPHLSGALPLRLLFYSFLAECQSEKFTFNEGE